MSVMSVPPVGLEVTALTAETANVRNLSSSDFISWPYVAFMTFALTYLGMETLDESEHENREMLLTASLMQTKIDHHRASPAIASPPASFGAL